MTNAKEIAVHDSLSVGRNWLRFGTFSMDSSPPSAEPRSTRVELASQMLQHLSSARYQGWDCFLTGDENRLYSSPGHKKAWLQCKDTRPVKEKKTASLPEVTLKVLWYVNGFALIEALPKG
jgi:hypothetical protein